MFDLQQTRREAPPVFLLNEMFQTHFAGRGLAGTACNDPLEMAATIHVSLPVFRFLQSWKNPPTAFKSNTPNCILISTLTFFYRVT